MLGVSSLLLGKLPPAHGLILEAIANLALWSGLDELAAQSQSAIDTTLNSPAMRAGDAIITENTSGGIQDFDFVVEMGSSEN